MQSTAITPDEYFEALPEDRKAVMQKLRQAILLNLPKGFEEQMGYGMPAYVVPHSVYPPGYHCDQKLPLPFVNIASQKNFIALYHMGIYADSGLFEWFTSEYPKHYTAKMDMGKSCIRFKKAESIPFDLIAQLMKKMSVGDWIETYEKDYKS
jgi:uncharacterized protein YdhG (YjbR/CyaY superfamily)